VRSAGPHLRAGRPTRALAFLIVLLFSALTVPGAAYGGGAITTKQLRGHIVNGGNAGGPIGWQVGIVNAVDGTGEKVPFEPFCGGTIRDATHIVTAAHCVPDSSAAELAVVANLYHRSDRGDAGAQVRPVSAITSHPKFRSADTGNDLAILTLSQPLTIGTAPPVTTANVPWVGAPAIISGWGLLSDRGPRPDALQAAVIQVLPDQLCGNYAERFLADTMLCAGVPNGPRTVDTCQGDSGGPLVANVGGQPLIGVVSFGVGCADPGFPGIYTRLSNPDLNARVRAANPPPRTEPVSGVTVQGAPVVGQTLTCIPGQWTLPATFTFAWLSARIDAGGRPTAVRSEGTAPTLALTTAHAGRVIGCTVTATHEGGSRDSSTKLVTVTTPAAVSVASPPPPPKALASDLVVPTSRVTRRSCKQRRCSLTIIASDSGGSATKLTVTYARITGCRKGATCRTAKTLRAVSKGNGVFTVTTPRLAPAAYRFSVIATDASGNRSKKVSVALRVRR
jgi:trypsin